MTKEDSQGLNRSIGFWSAVAINVGAIIGGGIFVVTGLAAGIAGSAFIVSMILAGVIAFLTASGFAELAAWQPVEGSVYEYGRQLVSPTAGFISGWMWVINNTFTGAAVSLGFGYYLSAIFPVLPSNYTAAIICLLFTAVNLVGIKQSALLNNILVTIKLAMLAFFAIYGAFFFNVQNFTPSIPISGGMFAAAFYIFFAYGGFARIAVIGEEVKDAKRVVPRAMIVSLAISMVVYIIVSIVAVGLLDPAGLGNSNSPLASALQTTGNMAAVNIISVGGLVATASVLLTSILGVSRMAFSMARRSEMPKPLATLHKRFRTPYISVVSTGLIMTLLALFANLNSVVVIGTFSLLFNYSIVNLAAYRLKIDRPKYKRIINLLGLSSCLMLMVFAVYASYAAALLALAFILAGLIYYLALKRYRRKKSSSS